MDNGSRLRLLNTESRKRDTTREAQLMWIHSQREAFKITYPDPANTKPLEKLCYDPH